MIVMKFGGTSVGTPERIASVAGIIQAATQRHDGVCVVASAFAGVTDQLIELSRTALARSNTHDDSLAALESRHLAAVDALLTGAHRTGVRDWVISQVRDLREIVHGIYLLRELTPRTLDAVMSVGERLSCRILAETLTARAIPATFVDSREIIKTDLTFNAARVNFDLTNWKIMHWFSTHTGVQVVTGFVASGRHNETTTLGRGGSDYTAAILGAAIDASEIQIWTDVDGVMTADPRKVPDAFALECITYEEAMELSHFGARVIHPPTMLPAMNKGIDLRILNTLRPDCPGTLVSARRVLSDRTVKGIASLDSIALISVRGIGMMRATGIAGRIFSALAKAEIDVVLITQSSSEHSVCCAILPVYRERAREAIELEFRLELLAGEITEVLVEEDFSVIAVVGEETRDVPGIAGKVFQALGKNGINIRAIAQGASELNVTFVVKQSAEVKALNALHDNLFLSSTKTVHAFVIGTGLVGGALLDLLREQAVYARDQLHVNLHVNGVLNTRRMLLDMNGIDLTGWRDRLAAARPANLGSFVDEVRGMNLANSIVIDCSGVEIVVDRYVPLFESSIAVLTSSKLANARSFTFYQQIRALVRKHNTQFRYSTNVGAALPIIDSLQAIMNSGDRVLRIEGVLSGTLSYLFNALADDMPFSEAVRKAKQRGFTEPDPRIDLGGVDVARKLLILAREAGIPLEMDEISIESLVLPDMMEEDSATFLTRLPELDQAIGRRQESAHARGARLLYIARFDEGRATVGVEEIPASHPFFTLTGSDNIVALTTRALYQEPLVLRGSGAGALRTASGLFTDILRTAHGMS